MRQLKELGFSEGESEIYLALLKLGSSNVMQLSKSTGRHRTHIYDTIEKLKEKGLVCESVVNNKKLFSASSPENILDYLKEKQEKAKSVVNDLKKVEISEKDGIKVDVYKGKSGLKSVLRDILREKKDYIGYGEGIRFEKVLPIFYEQFRNQSNKLKIGLRLILKKGVKISKRAKLIIRYLDFISPSTTFIYSGKIAVIIWEPFPIAIKITNKQIAQSYKNYFNFLWKLAKP